ncbi:hypothetical protein AB837_00558 [bacterium AB1]|nr:hypothetical protein AB837_00558 [bacterium AB1]
MPYESTRLTYAYGYNIFEEKMANSYCDQKEYSFVKCIYCYVNENLDKIKFIKRYIIDL